MKICVILLLFSVSFVHSNLVKEGNQYQFVLASKLNSVYDKIINPNSFHLVIEKIKNVKVQIKSLDRFNETLCSEQFSFISSALNNSEMWPINLFDAWGKVPSGVFFGNSYEFGNYDQCVEFRHDTKSIGEIRGQYCLSKIKFAEPDPALSALSKISVAIGLCVPDTCSPEFIKKTLDPLLNMSGLISEFKNTCVINESVKYEVIDWVAIVFFSLIALLMVCSTSYDLITQQYKKPVIPILIAFSVYTNGQRLFACKKSNSPDVMNCINGIRALSIIWVVIGHTYTLSFGTAINLTKIYDWMKNAHSMLLLSGTVSVDSFLLLSGLLITWSVLKELKRSAKINIPLMYFHRYLRLTPAFGAMILFAASLERYVGTGPIWNYSMDPSLQMCQKYWWSGLLYVQNYVNPKEICLGHSWYLSVDMQLFLLSPLILYPLWKWGKKFIGVVVVLILLSIGCVFATFYKNKFNVSMMMAGEAENMNRFFLIYFPTHTRMGPWLVGVILGYILHVLKDKRIVLSKVWIASGWIVSIGTILAIIFGAYNLQQPDHEENVIEGAFYDSLSRVAWSIALAWIIFACVKGYGGFVDSMLSLAFWVPVARVSYSLYLVHYVLQAILSGAARTNSYFTDINAIHAFWGDLGISLTISVLWTLAFESPITVLEKFLIKRKPSKGVQNGNTNNNEIKA